jgi:hypothetical protein
MTKEQVLILKNMRREDCKHYNGNGGCKLDDNIDGKVPPRWCLPWGSCITNFEPKEQSTTKEVKCLTD